MGAQCFMDLKLMIMGLRYCKYHLCTISVLVGGRRAVPKLMIPLEVVPFGKIVINPSDLKHAVELLGYSGGLGVVITTRTHLWGAF